MKVLVIPENPTHDQFIIKPVLEKLFNDLSLRCRVEVLSDPHLNGVEEALNHELLRRIIDSNPMVDQFVLIVDADCERSNATSRVRHIEAKFSPKLISCVAVQELEVWLLALYEHAEIRWSDMQEHCDSKEAYFDPFIKDRGWMAQVGGGRKRAMRALAGNFAKLLSRCPELRDLKTRIQTANC